MWAFEKYRGCMHLPRVALVLEILVWVGTSVHRHEPRNALVYTLEDCMECGRCWGDTLAWRSGAEAFTKRRPCLESLDKHPSCILNDILNNTCVLVIVVVLACPSTRPVGPSGLGRGCLTGSSPGKI